MDIHYHGYINCYNIKILYFCVGKQRAAAPDPDASPRPSLDPAMKGLTPATKLAHIHTWSGWEWGGKAYKLTLYWEVQRQGSWSEQEREVRQEKKRENTREYKGM